MATFAVSRHHRKFLKDHSFVLYHMMVTLWNKFNKIHVQKLVFVQKSFYFHMNVPLSFLFI